MLNTAMEMANLVYQSKIAAQLQQYHHSIMGALPVKTLTAAIKEGCLLPFPGLSVKAVHMQVSTRICLVSHGPSPHDL